MTFVPTPPRTVSGGIQQVPYLIEDANDPSYITYPICIASRFGRVWASVGSASMPSLWRGNDTDARMWQRDAHESVSRIEGIQSNLTNYAAFAAFAYLVIALALPLFVP